MPDTKASARAGGGPLVPDTLIHPIDQLIKAHDTTLSGQFGYPVKQGAWDVISSLMDQSAQREEFYSAIRLLRCTLPLYPESALTFVFIVRANTSIGYRHSACIVLQHTLEFKPENRYAQHFQRQFDFERWQCCIPVCLFCSLT